MNKKLILVVTALSSCAHLSSFFNFDIWDDQFEQIEKGMKKMRKQFKKGVQGVQLPERSTVHVSLKEEADAVVVTFTGLETIDTKATDSDKEIAFEAYLNDARDRLSITTPEHRLALTVRGNVITIETAYEQKEVHKKDETEDTFTAQFMGSSYSSISQTVGSKLLLEQRTIDLDEKKGELIVRIPKEPVTKGTPVAINKIHAEETTAIQDQKAE